MLTMPPLVVLLRNLGESAWLYAWAFVTSFCIFGTKSLKPLDSDAGCDVARAMKAHEMFAKVLKKKGLPLVDGAVAALRARLLEAKGDAASEAPKARA